MTKPAFALGAPKTRRGLSHPEIERFKREYIATLLDFQEWCDRHEIPFQQRLTQLLRREMANPHKESDR